MVDIKKVDEKYYRDPDFSEKEYFAHCMGIMKDGKPEKVILEFDQFQSKYIENQPIHKTQKVIKRTGDKVVVELEVYITHELLIKIFSYREHVKVLAPKKLVKEVTKKLKEVIEKYR